jgi:uncharacterized protein YabN with tetrapyrrole methylase and pyrophosphatase domain
MTAIQHTSATPERDARNQTPERDARNQTPPCASSDTQTAASLTARPIIAAAGSLTCVGLGMLLGADLTPAARHAIEQADKVFASVADGVFELWLKTLNPHFESLQPHYCEGTSRLVTYQQMVAVILQDVRAGLRVCVALYGHPGVFAWPAHRAIALARAEGFAARMLPGVSAADCLYADLGIDPGTHGCVHSEATQWLLFERTVDTAGFLILWQVGVVGDLSLSQFSTDTRYRQLLLTQLLHYYPPTHQITLYEAANLATCPPRIERCALSTLLELDISLRTTVVIPPVRERAVDSAIRAQLESLQRADSVAV